MSKWQCKMKVEVCRLRILLQGVRLAWDKLPLIKGQFMKGYSRADTEIEKIIYKYLDFSSLI